MSMTVNVSAIQLQHPAFLDHVRESLRASGVPASNLVVELTESVLTDRDDAARVLEDVKATGVRIALDDFGTGYSSLSHLGRFPIDVLKIDRSFTSALGTASKEAALTATILELASTLELTTIAEGVEEPEQLAALAELGCDMCQGFLLARPLQPAVVAGLIDKEQQRAAAQHGAGTTVLDLQPAIGFRRGGSAQASGGTHAKAPASARGGGGARR
jgi:Amt family ammonium transporter